MIENDIDERDIVTVKDLYHDDNQNLRFAKSQQWKITNYVILIYAGWFGLFGILIKQGNIPDLQLKWVILGLSAIVWGYGFLYIVSLSIWIGNIRKRLRRIYRDYRTDRFDKVRKEKDRKIWLEYLIHFGFYVAIFAGWGVLIFAVVVN